MLIVRLNKIKKLKNTTKNPVIMSRIYLEKKNITCIGEKFLQKYLSNIVESP